MRTFSLFTIYFLVIFCYFSCGNNNKPLSIDHVYCNVDPAKKEYEFGRHDFYYVYNYELKDSSVIWKTIDTLTNDILYARHVVFFYEYDYNMPDTISLNRAMKDYYSELEDGPGEASHYKNLIASVFFQKSYISNGKTYPKFTIISKIQDGKEKERFYTKNSINGKLEKVPTTEVFSNMN